MYAISSDRVFFCVRIVDSLDRVRSPGFATTCALNALGGIIAIILYASYKQENEKRNALHGHPDPDASVDMNELADKVSAVNIFGMQHGC